MSPAHETAPPPGLVLPDVVSREERRRLELLVGELARPDAASSVDDPAEIWKVHIADSLSGIEPGEIADGMWIADVGAGAGLPGLVLAIVFPASRVDLIESIGKKCEYIDRTASALGITNARAVHARAEEWALAEGREAYDRVTARAVGRLSTLAELASPLLKTHGALVAWKGKRDPGEEAEAERGVTSLAMSVEETRSVGPYAGSRHRHIHRLRKNGPTPDGIPRRPGMAKKKPLGAERGS